MSIGKLNEEVLNNRVQFYKDRQKEIASGKKNSIPFQSFKRLNSLIPGIIPGIMYKVTSHSGVGKTQISKSVFVYDTIEYAIKYNLQFTIMYVCMEESKEEFIDSLYIHLLGTKLNVKLSRFKLEGYVDTPLTDLELKAIAEITDLVAKYLSYIEIIDDCYKPTSIYNRLRYIAVKHGKFTKIVNPDGSESEIYEPRNKYHKFLVITDHISLIEEEFNVETSKFLSKQQSIAKWHTDYARKIVTKIWKFACLNIQQQSLESESQQFTTKGDSIIEKIIPSLDGVANNREVVRDDYVVLGLFSPDRYGIKDFRGYKINPSNPGDDYLGDNFRTLHVLKARIGRPNGVIPLFFDGSINHFEELPIPNDAAGVAALQTYYNYSKNNR